MKPLSKPRHWLYFIGTIITLMGLSFRSGWLILFGIGLIALGVFGWRLGIALGERAWQRSRRVRIMRETGKGLVPSTISAIAETREKRAWLEHEMSLGQLSILVSASLPYGYSLSEDESAEDFIPTIRQLESEGYTVRFVAPLNIRVEGINSAEFLEAVPLIVGDLQQKPKRIRIHVGILRNLTFLGLDYSSVPGVLEAIIALLNSKDWFVQDDAAIALTGFKDPKAADALIRYFEIKNRRRFDAAPVAIDVIDAIGEMKDPRAIGYLVNILVSGRMGITPNLFHALRKITGEDFGEDTSEWHKWWEENKAKYSKIKNGR